MGATQPILRFFLFVGLSLGTPRVVAAPMPGFKLEGVDGPAVDSKDLKGQVYVVQFWASWCSSCGGLTKDLGWVLDQARTRPRLLSVSLDETREAAAKGLARIRIPGAREQSYHFDRDRMLADALGQVAVPTIVVVGKNGEVLSKISGHFGDAQKNELAARLNDQ